MSFVKLRRRPLLTAAAVFAGGAAALWALGIAVHLSPPADRADLAGAICLTVLAGLAVAVRLGRDRDKDMLVRALIDVSQRAAAAKTEPLPQLRRVK